MKRHYFEIYNIDLEIAKERAIYKTPNGYTTAAVEMLGEAIIERHNIWKQLFPDFISATKATSIKDQKDGIDFFITLEDDTVINIDIKVCSGPDYSFKKERAYVDPSSVRLVKPEPECDYILNQAPIELKQNGIVTFTTKKKTHHLLFIFADTNGVSYSLVDYNNVLFLVDNNINYRHFISNNGSGEYILCPVKSRRVV